MDRLREVLTRNARGLTIYELAEALKVSPRTMRRYLKELGREYDLDCVTPTRGGAQIWRIRASELPRKVELRRTQAYALLAARRVFEPLKGSTLYDEIEMATQRLMAVAQRPGRGPNSGLADARLEDRFLYLPYAPKNYQRKMDELEDLFQAVSDLRPLMLNYRRSGEKRDERITVHPYAMILHRESVYCVGRHVEGDKVRTFVLDRMRHTEISVKERFALPDDFSVDAYFQGEFGIWRAPGESQTVVIDFDARARDNIAMRRVHHSQTLEKRPDGGLRLTMVVGNLTPVVNWVLEWGSLATAVAPQELVDRVRDELAGALVNYAVPRVRRAKK